MTTSAPDRRTFFRAVGLTAAAGLGTAALAPAATAAGETVLPTTYREQPNFFYCGPTAVSIALSAKVTPPSLDTLAAELGTTDNGTNFGSVSPVLTNRLAGATYRDQWMDGSTASDADANLLWDRATTNVDDGFATVCNWWVVAGDSRTGAGTPRTSTISSRSTGTTPMPAPCAWRIRPDRPSPHPFRPITGSRRSRSRPTARGAATSGELGTMTATAPEDPPRGLSCVDGEQSCRSLQPGSAAPGRGQRCPVGVSGARSGSAAAPGPEQAARDLAAQHGAGGAQERLHSRTAEQAPSSFFAEREESFEEPPDLFASGASGASSSAAASFSARAVRIS